jgi:hypothetical protein
MITDAGKNAAIQRLDDASATVAVFNYVAIGTDGTAPTSADTALGAEIGTRVQDTDATPDPPSPAGSQALVAVFAAGNGIGTVREVGLFNASVGGTMLMRKVFTAIEKDAGATLTITLTSSFD